MDVLLTDDEVVALAVAAETGWPYGLLTVAADDRAVMAAGIRGLRSLAVRGLVGTGAPHGLEYPRELVEQVGAIAGAPRHVMAQVCVRDNLVRPRGAMLGAFFAGAPESPWLVDSVTSNGVHAIWAATVEEVADVLLRFVQAVWADGVLSPDSGATLGLFVTSSRAGSESFFVSRGSTEALVRTGVPGLEFPARQYDEPWDLTTVDRLLRS